MNFEYLSFDAIFKFEKKSNKKASDGLKNGQFPFYTSSQILAKYTDSPDYNEESLVIGTGGKPSIHITNSYFSTSSDCIVATPIESKKIHLKYVYFFFIGNMQILDNGFKGAGLKHISKAYIKEIQIPLPPLKIQKKIAEILSQADLLRQQAKQMETDLNQLAQSIFIDMFGDPGLNPHEWPVLPLKDLLSKPSINGAYYPKESYLEIGTKMIHMSDVFQGIAKTDGVKQVNSTSSEVEKYRLTTNDILISRRSLTYEGAAKPCLIPDVNEDLIFESSMIRVSPCLEKLNTKYLYHYLDNKRVRGKYVFPLVTRSTISGINQANLMKVRVLLPPIELQEIFDIKINKINDAIKSNALSILKYEELFDSLMQQAFKGELVA